MAMTATANTLSALASVSSLAGARVVITGAAGFIGRNLVRALVAGRPRSIVAIDTRRPADLAPASPFPTGLVLAESDILSRLDELVEGADVVFHLAAKVSVPGSVADPLSDAAVNVTGTIALLDACRRTGVRRIVYSSSAAVYGPPAYLPIDEQHPTRPSSPYGLSKLTGERYCLLYGQLYGLSVCALRYFNVYGPNQPRNGGYAAVIPRFFDRVTRRLPIVVEGDGSQTRDFVHVDDVVRANLLASVAGFDGVVNVGSGRATSIRELAGIIGGPGYPIEHAPSRVGDIDASVAAIGAARDAIGYRPSVGLETGLMTMLSMGA